MVRSRCWRCSSSVASAAWPRPRRSSPTRSSLGAQGGALALLCAWATPDLLTLRSGGDVDGDLIGAAVIAVAVALMPLADGAASWVSDGVGIVAGFAVGIPLALIGER